MICSKCHVICDEVCPKCGKTKYLRSAEAQEPVLLMVITNVQRMFVEPVLQEEKIPYNCIGRMGGALTAYLGSMLETYSVFVPYEVYDAAYETLKNVFAEESDIIKAMDEFRAGEGE